MKRPLFILGLTICTFTIYAQNKYHNPDIPLADSYEGFYFTNIVYTAKENSFVELGGDLGKVAPLPKFRSDKYENEIQSSEKYYRNGNFKEAKEILDNPFKKEPNNLFILNAYARAAYNFNKTESFRVYRILVQKLDSTYSSTPTKPATALWFREAYWKYGTLLMDNSKWKEAYFEISRFIGSIQDEKGSRIYIQALEFLTECAYMQYDDKLAKYLAGRVLFYDSNNVFVKDLLTKMK